MAWTWSWWVVRSSRRPTRPRRRGASSRRLAERLKNPRKREPRRWRRQAPAIELLVGVHPVREALRARRRRLLRLCIRAGRAGRRPEVAEIMERADALKIPIEELAPAAFDRVAPSGTRSQGVLLEAGPLPWASPEELAALEPAPRWLVALDGIEDPQNLGAVARVAEAAGAHGLLLPSRRVAPLSPAASRASSGALELLPTASVGNLPRSLDYLKGEGFWVFGADAEGGEDLFRAPPRLFQGDLVLVLGGEARGLRPAVRGHVDGLVRVPMAGRVGSLNVAAAAAVVLFEWRRRSRLTAGG